MPKTITRLFRPGGALNLALGAMALIAILWAGSLAARGPFSAPHAPRPLANNELAAGLTRVGLNAESLAAAGATAPQVQALVANARDYLDTNIQALRDCDRAWAKARQEADRLTGLVVSGTGSGRDATDLAAARDTLRAQAARRQALLDNLFAAATADLPRPHTAVLADIRANRDAGWDLPTPYLAAHRPDSAWVALKDALATQRIHAEQGLPEHQGANRLLLAEHSNPNVAAAHINLDTLHGQTTQAWSQAIKK